MLIQITEFNFLILKEGIDKKFSEKVSEERRCYKRWRLGALIQVEMILHHLCHQKLISAAHKIIKFYFCCKTVSRFEFSAFFCNNMWLLCYLLPFYIYQCMSYHNAIYHLCFKDVTTFYIFIIFSIFIILYACSKLDFLNSFHFSHFPSLFNIWNMIHSSLSKLDSVQDANRTFRSVGIPL